MKNSVLILLAWVAVAFAQRGRPPPPPPPARPKPTTPPVINGPLNLTFIISGKTIPSKDPASKVDAFVKVFAQTGSKDETRLGTTDVIQDDDNPTWLNVFWVIWKRGTGQKLRLVIRDNDRFARDEDVGEVVMNLDEYVSSGQDLKALLVGGGQIHVQGTQPFKFKLFARNIPHMDSFGGKSDPFVEVYWRQGIGADHLIATTAVINNEDNPDWVEVLEFANYRKGTQQLLYFKVYDHDGVTRNDFVGAQILDADSFVTKRQTVIVNLTTEEGKALPTNVPIGIVPA
ncbi:unnamed protein product [Allacma fusca]|uniref:C2 domain-containing protein n=1 Tax=Allacma fusca TaxID=39272 RepID=A0A8J2L3Q6_9HEXA|nr:unnamed protein product [Allacma fusca]